MAKDRKTKTNDVLNHLQEHGSITSWEAIERYGATRLSAIIFNLKERGYAIETHSIVGKDRNENRVCYAQYRLVQEEHA